MTDKQIGSNFDDFLKEECIEFEEQELKKTKLRKNRKDLTGMKFGKLLCLKPVKTGKNNHSEWFCECECGNLKIAQTYRLLSGRIRSCGDCYHTTNHYIPMIKELKQECEDLKIYIESNEQQVKEVETLVMDNDRLINELNQLKQVLSDIKNIVETCNSGVDCSECPYTKECRTDIEAEALGVCNLILQKFEVLNDI